MDRGAWGAMVHAAAASCFSRVRLSVTPWTEALQALLFMGFSRQEYWSGLPSPSPGDPPDPGIKPGSPALEADALTLSTREALSTKELMLLNCSPGENS